MASIPSAGTALLSAVTATTTSAGQNVENFDSLVVQFTAASITSGNGVLTIDATVDGINWYAAIAFVDLTSTTTTTAVVSKTLSSNGTSLLAVPYGGFKAIRVKVTVTTDGNYTVFLSGNARR